MSTVELCRLCAETKDNFIGIYDSEGLKLAIESKIAKCLQIQILVTDTLPLLVCLDCCILLNQCNDFYEKTNLAQLSLQQICNSKQEPLSLHKNIAYIESVENFTVKSDEAEEGLIECEYIDLKTDDCTNESYFNDDQDNEPDNQEFSKDDDQTAKDSKLIDKGRKLEKKIVVRQVKKKMRKKSPIRKLVDFGDNDMVTQLVNQNNQNGETKSNVKIPDNYMTGSASDIQMIETSCAQRTNSNQKGGEILDRYPWLCTDCNDKLPSLETLEQHHESVHNQKAKFMCVQCCKVYEKYYGFLTHVKRHKMKTKFTCEECGKSFTHKKVLESHKAVHSEERPHTCQTCGKTFRQQSALYIHSRCHLPDTVKNRFPCDQCNKRFSTKPNLVTHKRIHSGVRNFTCDQCGKSFVQKGNLEAHFLTHSVDKPYNCTQCTKAFKTPLQLKKHESVHTGAKPHQCTVCGRTFREKGTLREHHRIHTGAMPFTCEFCGKCFRFKGILTTHRRQHTGERPYSCVECQHHFTNWPNYNKHMKRRHGIDTSSSKRASSQQQQAQIERQSTQVSHPDSDGIQVVQEVSATTVQVIQTVSTTQPIVVQAIPTSVVQTFPSEISAATSVQDAVFRERSSTYFNAVPTTLQNFLPANLPYNFYNISNVNEGDLIQHR